MNQFDRIYIRDITLHGRRTPISIKALIQKLECSRAAVARTIEDLRDCLRAPVKSDRKRGGYRHNQAEGEHPYQLPGLWFSAQAPADLLICDQLLHKIGSGILRPQIDHLQSRIEELFSQHGYSFDAPGRVRILSIGSRMQNDFRFLRIAPALFDRKRLQIVYRTRNRDEETSREISPQILIDYRDHLAPRRLLPLASRDQILFRRQNDFGASPRKRLRQRKASSTRGELRTRFAPIQCASGTCS